MSQSSEDADDFSLIVKEIYNEDARFDPDAYYFLRQALDYTVRREAENPKPRKGHHVSGQELLQGIREFALDQFGPMTMTVLDYWGIHACRDFGEIVFHLVDHGVLGKTDEDSKSDFADIYSFEEAFVKPFLPNTALKKN